MRRDIAPAQTARDQVAVEHPGPALRGAGGVGRQDEFRLEIGQLGRRRRRVGPSRQPYGPRAPGEDRRVRIVRRIDDVEPEPEAAEQLECRVQLGTDELELGRVRLAAAQSFFGPFFGAAFLAAAGAFPGRFSRRCRLCRRFRLRLHRLRGRGLLGGGFGRSFCRGFRDRLGGAWPQPFRPGGLLRRRLGRSLCRLLFSLGRASRP